jgi:hypothetical protein
MINTWHWRALAVYLGALSPLAASCAREANSLEDDDAAGGGASSKAGATSKAGASSKAGATTNPFGGTNTGSGGRAPVGLGAEPSTEGGDSSVNAGGTAGVRAGGGTSAVGVPPSVLANASAIVYYQTDKATAATNVISMRLYVENKSSDPLPLANVKLRYWFTAEVTPTLHNYFNGNAITGELQTFVSDGPNSHVLFSFSGTSLAQGADLNASEIQLQIDNNTGMFAQADDFSWQPAYTSRMPHDKITLYLADELIWGCEPSGKCAAAGAGGAP